MTASSSIVLKDFLYVYSGGEISSLSFSYSADLQAGAHIGTARLDHYYPEFGIVGVDMGSRVMYNNDSEHSF